MRLFPVLAVCAAVLIVSLSSATQAVTPVVGPPIRVQQIGAGPVNANDFFTVSGDQQNIGFSDAIGPVIPGTPTEAYIVTNVDVEQDAVNGVNLIVTDSSGVLLRVIAPRLGGSDLNSSWEAGGRGGAIVRPGQGEQLRFQVGPFQTANLDIELFAIHGIVL